MTSLLTKIGGVAWGAVATYRVNRALRRGSSSRLPNATQMKGQGVSDARQQRQRIVRYFDCTWLSPWGVERSRLSNLSPTGCYVDSRPTVPALGDLVRDITVSWPTGTLCLQGIVTDATKGVGFAVRFTELDADTRDRLRALVQALST